MKKQVLIIGIIASTIFSVQTLQAQTAPSIQWDKTIGGNDHEKLGYSIQTSDGGFLLGGASFSDTSGDKTASLKGGEDYWLIKLDAYGNIIWDKTFGGVNSELISSIVQTSDGGYVLGGVSYSNISGDKSEISRGGGDFWVVKIDSNGNKIWDKCFGGANDEHLGYIQQTNDGGYIVGGTSHSGIGGDKSEASRGKPDFWVVRLDSVGNKLWDRTYGGNDDDYFSSIIQTLDGGFIMVGPSWSQAGLDKTHNSKGSYDFWVVKLDSAGNKTWDKSIGGMSGDWPKLIKQTPNGDYIIGGSSSSNTGGDKSQNNIGFGDYWLVSLDNNGIKLWDKTIGGNNVDSFGYFDLTSDGGYILGGTSRSGIGGDKTEVNLNGGYEDYWIVKLDSSRNKLWDKTIGGNEAEVFLTVRQTVDEGFILSGYSNSGISGSKTQMPRGDSDFWIVKLGPQILGLSKTQTTNLILYPNPTSGLIHLDLKDQQPTQISVYNSLGQTILTQTEAQPNPDGKLQLDLSNQAKGIYTVQVISGNQSAVKKVVLQ